MNVYYNFEVFYILQENLRDKFDKTFYMIDRVKMNKLRRN